MFANRRKQTAVGLVLLVAAYVLHGAASEATRRGITPGQGDAPGREDEFFGEDPREFALRPENQARLAAARHFDGLALAVAGCGVFILTFPLLSRRRDSFRDVAGRGDTGASSDDPAAAVTRPAGLPDGPPAGRS